MATCLWVVVVLLACKQHNVPSHGMQQAPIHDTRVLKGGGRAEKTGSILTDCCLSVGLSLHLQMWERSVMSWTCLRPLLPLVLTW